MLVHQLLTHYLTISPTHYNHHLTKFTSITSSSEIGSYAPSFTSRMTVPLYIDISLIYVLTIHPQ